MEQALDLRAGPRGIAPLIIPMLIILSCGLSTKRDQCHDYSGIFRR